MQLYRVNVWLFHRQHLENTDDRRDCSRVNWAWATRMHWKLLWVWKRLTFRALWIKSRHVWIISAQAESAGRNRAFSSGVEVQWREMCAVTQLEQRTDVLQEEDIRTSRARWSRVFEEQPDRESESQVWEWETERIMIFCSAARLDVCCYSGIKPAALGNKSKLNSHSVSLCVAHRKDRAQPSTQEWKQKNFKMHFK